MDNMKRHVSRPSSAYRNDTAWRVVRESTREHGVWINAYEMEVVML